jgi:hypothetical protein
MVELRQEEGRCSRLSQVVGCQRPRCCCHHICRAYRGAHDGQNMDVKRVGYVYPGVNADVLPAGDTMHSHGATCGEQALPHRAQSAMIQHHEKQ